MEGRESKSQQKLEVCQVTQGNTFKGKFLYNFRDYVIRNILTGPLLLFISGGFPQGVCDKRAEGGRKWELEID